jgi:hypothetical protein
VWLGSVLRLHIYQLKVMSMYRAAHINADALIEVAISWYWTRVVICLCVLMFCDKHSFQMVTMLVSAARPIHSGRYKHVPVFNNTAGKCTVLFWCNFITGYCAICLGHLRSHLQGDMNRNTIVITKVSVPFHYCK